MQERWLELARERQCGELAREQLLSTRLPGLELNRCYVSESGIPNAGRGVFAKRHISAGELITIFPGDGLCIQTPREEEDIWLKARGQSEESVLELQHRGKDYALEVDWPPGDLYVIGDPDLADDPAYLGHILNDGSTCLREADKSMYKCQSKARLNADQVVLDGCHVAFTATRDITKGEELFFSYGAGYWLHRPPSEKKFTEVDRARPNRFRQRVRSDHDGHDAIGRSKKEHGKQRDKRKKSRAQNVQELI